MFYFQESNGMFKTKKYNNANFDTWADNDLQKYNKYKEAVCVCLPILLIVHHH